MDPANEAGFDNSGESLTMSPALLKKYLAAARLVADHLVIKPDGLGFAPHPMMTDVDRDKYCVRRILEFYRNHEVELRRLLPGGVAVRAPSGTGEAGEELERRGSRGRLERRYLDTIHAALTDAWPAQSPLGELQALWRKLPNDAASQNEIRSRCDAMQELVVRLRKGFEPRVEPLRVKGISPGSQPLVLARNRQLAAMHMEYPGNKPSRDLEVFCRVFPDAFVVSDRGPYFDPKAAGKGRPLTAGFHLMQGYFRDDGPLSELVLDETDQRQLDALWWELNFITGVPIRQYNDFIFFERAEPPRFMRPSEFDFARSEDKDAISAAKIEQLRVVYLARAKKMEASEAAIQAIETYFTEMSRAHSQGRAGAALRRASPLAGAHAFRTSEPTGDRFRGQSKPS